MKKKEFKWGGELFTFWKKIEEKAMTQLWAL